jgi:hypothetical protein
MRSAKYLNAREYAERLRLSDNRDVQDFAEEFIEALDNQDDTEISEIRAAIDDAAELAPEGSYKSKVEWLAGEASALDEIEDLIKDKCPEYTALIDSRDTLEVIAGMIARLRPVQEYDL